MIFLQVSHSKAARKNFLCLSLASCCCHIIFRGEKTTAHTVFSRVYAGLAIINIAAEMLIFFSLPKTDEA